MSEGGGGCDGEKGQPGYTGSGGDEMDEIVGVASRGLSVCKGG